MLIHADAHHKLLKLNDLQGVLKQGEKLADIPVFVLPKERAGIDLSSLTWALTAATDKKTFTGVFSLQAAVVNSELHIPWSVTSEFTAVATRKMDLTLTGSDGAGKIIVKFEGDTPIDVSRAKTGEYAPPPYVLDQAIAQALEAAKRAEVAAEGAEDAAAAAGGYAQQAQNTIEQGIAQINTILEQGMIIQNPLTGLREPVQAVFESYKNWIERLHNYSPIMPEEFDALLLTPEAFDAMTIDPFEFDTNGKNIIN